VRFSDFSSARSHRSVNTSFAALLVATIFLTSCRYVSFSPATSAGGLVIPTTILPERLSGGLALAGAPERYGPLDLWKKIDGAADLFVSYGFRELLIAGFSRAGAKLSEIEVSLYEMGSDLNAMGVYLQERSEGGDPAGVGWEGYRSGVGLYFHKGPYYVKIVDLSKEGTLGAQVGEVARRIDGAIQVPRQTIAKMTVFPPDGLIAGSILYVHRDAMGHGFLQRVFQANYTVAGKTATLFYCRQKDADQLLVKYRDYGKEFGKIEREWKDDDLSLLAVQAFSNPELVFARGDVFGGIVGCPDQAAALRLIRALLENIARELGPHRSP